MPGLTNGSASQRAADSLSQSPLHSPVLQWALIGQGTEPVTDRHQLSADWVPRTERSLFFDFSIFSVELAGGSCSWDQCYSHLGEYAFFFYSWTSLLNSTPVLQTSEPFTIQSEHSIWFCVVAANTIYKGIFFFFCFWRFGRDMASEFPRPGYFFIEFCANAAKQTFFLSMW